ncbi:MAG: hypothetical protein ACRD0Q_05685 [Acidimicrobiales bacterium]
MNCPSCGRGQLVEIRLTVADRPMSMRSCPSCERRWWESNGELLPLGSVLELVSSR